MTNDEDELGDAIRDICWSQELIAIYGREWHERAHGDHGPRVSVPGCARFRVPQRDILPIMDWAFLARVWSPETDAVCSDRWWCRDRFDTDSATLVLYGFVRRWCAQQEREATAKLEIQRAVAPGNGRRPGLLADARYLRLCDAAHAAGIWMPEGDLFAKVG